MKARKPIDLLTIPDAFREAQQLARSLCRLEVVITVDGITQRCSLRTAGDNAVITATIDGLALGLTCRTRGGSATLVGIDELNTPSTPPRKYLLKTFSGEMNLCKYNNAGCSGVNGSEAVIWNMSCRYDPATGLRTRTGQATVKADGGLCPAVTELTPNTNCDFVRNLSNSNAHYDLVLTPTSSLLTAAIGCTGPVIGLYANSSGIESIQLTEEDTEADAIARFRAANAFGAWQSGGNANSHSSYEARTSGFSFAIRETEYRIARTRLTPSTEYAVTLDVYRKLTAAASYELYQTLFLSGETDANGNLTITGTVPNDPGYDTYVANPELV